MFTPQLTIPQWLSLPMPIRLRLKSIFSIPRSSGSEVVNTVVMSDGHTHADLAVVTVEKMQQYLFSDETDFYKLISQVVDKVTREYNDEINAKIATEVENKARASEEKLNAIREYTKEISNYVDDLRDVPAKKKPGRPRK